MVGLDRTETFGGTVMRKKVVRPDLSFYERAAERRRMAGASATQARHEVAESHGYRTWWLLLAAIAEALPLHYRYDH